MPPTTNSDSEDDFDYVPSADENDSDSSDDDFERGATEGSLPPAPLSDPAKQKKQRDTLWASFQASIATPASNGDGKGDRSSAPLAEPPPVKHVQIERAYLFAGKHVTEVVEVPEDSEEAKQWPRWSPRQSASNVTSVSTSALASASQNEKEQQRGEGEGKNKGKNGGDTPAPSSASLSPAPPTTTTSIPSAKRPGPRKPRTTLPSIPQSSQAKKITTLDKCAIDWRAHVASQSSDVKDELDANRRGGGYLEKVDFLKRVEDRREDAFEASKASKRRKT